MICGIVAGSEMMGEGLGEYIRLIEKLRSRLEELVICRGTINDSEVLAASQNLDTAINYYLLTCRAQNKNQAAGGGNRFAEEPGD